MVDRTSTRALGDLLGAPDDAPPVILRLRRVAIREVRLALKNRSVPEAAELLGCHRSTVARWVQRGYV